MERELKVIFTGGGSGGHTMPAFAMIEALREHFSKNEVNLSVFYIGSSDGIEKEMAIKYNVEYFTVKTGKLRRYFSLKNFSDVFRVLGGIRQAAKIIENIKPDVLISTGGFVSIPPVIAAKHFVDIPVLVHEQTIDAGLANRIGGIFADKVALTFEESKKKFPAEKCVYTGMPLRPMIFKGNKKAALEKFGFSKELPVVYFTGGGLGCHLLNKTAFGILPELLKKVNIIFQTGKASHGKDYKKMVKLKASLDSELQNRLVIYDFINEEIADIFAVADLAVGRSGAGTVNEFMAMNIPAIYIPLAIATKNEQFKNALYVKNIGGAVIMEEDVVSEQLLKDSIISILFGKKHKEMKVALKKHTSSNGLENMLNLILEYAK